MTNVEYFDMTGGNVQFTLVNGDLAAGQHLTVDASSVDVGSMVLFDGFNQAGRFTFIGGNAFDEMFVGGNGANVFTTPVATDILALTGGSGRDVVNIDGDPASNRESYVDAGFGSNTLNLNGGLSARTHSFGPESQANVQLIGFEHINLATGFDYTFDATENVDEDFGHITVNGSALGAGDMLNFNSGPTPKCFFTLEGGAGDDILVGGAKADTLIGGGGDDVLDLTAGGNDTANGGAGDDHINLGSMSLSSDQINGGGGTDDLTFSGGDTVVFDATSLLKSIEILTPAAGHNYHLSATDAFVASGHTLTVDGGALGAGDTLVYDGSGETDGQLILLGGSAGDTLNGGARNDTFDGGNGNDVFNMGVGGNDTADGDGGNDVFNLGAAFNAADRIDGGSGNDTVNLDGDYSTELALGGATLANVETLHFAAGSSYNIKLGDGNVGIGKILTVDGSNLGAGDSLRFIGANASVGQFVIIGGAGNDYLAGGRNHSDIEGGLGADHLRGNHNFGGTNTFIYADATESTGPGYDTIFDFGLTDDAIKLPFVPLQDAAVVTGSLSQATFDTDLAAAVGAGQLEVNHYLIFAPDSGDLAGHAFIIVDGNGTAGYQAEQDYVILIGAGSYTGSPPTGGIHFI
jgi:Ca2+-binding RTX toxin-like protein